MSGPTPIPLSFIPMDVALGLPMFARIYLLCRSITFHSRFLRDSSSRSLGYLNKVPINFFFIIKAYLEQSPALCLVIFFMLMFCIGSWSLRACNYTTTNQHLPIANAMWMFMTLFTTVGYGDLIPSTYCGRGVATITAIIGVMISAFLIAVLSQILLLNRWEKYIYNFGLNIEMAKTQKFYAANIIFYAWKVWRLNRSGMQRSIEYVYAQRKLFGAISNNQTLKQEQRQLADHNIGLAELMTAHPFRRFLITVGGNTTTGKCLDVAGGNAELHSQIQLFRCHGKQSQQFELHRDGTIRIMGKCLDIPDSKAYDHQSVQLFHCHSAQENQRFIIDAQNRIHVMGKCLDVPNGQIVNNNPLQLFRCHNEASQRFTLTPL
ncbi:unnamed protein product [Rotaria sordida]|uniref:Ricin B lectin domain-containing protein n=1 Tax=Rotaria sordida TaxID=392033 RepID=A0A814SHF5_9BILA|nr:unnamed protein product [Rotaria sordida]CAF1383647.1 unnamed protein product [Rotaria sordida]